ncbi:hypothetical protein OV320_2570 [Actinobacteria bacterium OV320]|jgi:hypothetical protein|nr:hypothetical protein OV320_2570 [Actinobacteria bacterium OV320]
MDMDYAQLSNVYASGLVTLCCTIFAVVYHLHAPWGSTPVGRHVMTFTLAIGALAAYTVVVSIWPDGIFATVMRFARVLLLLGIASLVIQRTRMVLTAQHDGVLLHENDPHDDSVT